MRAVFDSRAVCGRVRVGCANMGGAAAYVIASSERGTYTVETSDGPRKFEAELVNEQGLLVQRCSASGAVHEVRVSPVGADGQPHFEYLEQEDAASWEPGRSSWRPVAPQIVQMLAACAAGRGDAYYSIGSEAYHAKLGHDGFIDQKHLQTGVVRPLRPAPWLGHGQARVVDATDGFVPTAAALPMAAVISFGPLVEGVATPMRSASEFYQPLQVPMGTMLEPVLLPMATPIAAPQPLMHYYQPAPAEAPPFLATQQGDAPSASPILYPLPAV